MPWRPGRGRATAVALVIAAVSQLDDGIEQFGGNLGLDYEVYAVPALPTTGQVCSDGQGR
jgi:hypothetical protein